MKLNDVSPNIKQTMSDLKTIYKESKDPIVKEAAKVKYAELKAQLPKGYGDIVQPTGIIRKPGSDVVQAGPLKNLSNPKKEVEESPQSDIRLAAMRKNNPQPQVGGGNPFGAKKSGPTNPPTSSGIARGVRMGEANEGVDTIQMNVELFIRCLEWSKEDAPDDMALHKFTENVVAKSGVLTMADYDDLIPQGEMTEATMEWPKVPKPDNSHKGPVATWPKVPKPDNTHHGKAATWPGMEHKQVKEDASAGASGSASIATAPPGATGPAGKAGSLFAPVKETAKKPNKAAERRAAEANKQPGDAEETARLAGIKATREKEYANSGAKRLRQIGKEKKKSAIGEGLDTVSEAPQGSTEELQVGNMVRIRDANRSTYGKIMKVMKIDGDEIYCGGRNFITLPYRREVLQYLPRQVEEDRYDDAWAKEKAKANKIANAKAKPVVVKPEPKAKPDPMRIMHDIDVAIGNNFPDGDPSDSLSGKYTMEILDWAVRKAGAGKNYNDYIAHEWQSAMDDNPQHDGQKNPFR